MKTYKSFFGIFFCLVFTLSSCVSEKKITYFQPAENTTDPVVAEIINTYTPRIQEGDILNVMVSSISKEANEMFNPHPASTNMYFNQTAGTTAPQPAVGFWVDENGNIELPMVGNMHVKGMTIPEVTSALTKELNKYLKSPTVNVLIANFKVTVLGEVNRPAVYTVPNETMTLPQAIAYAGDLTIYGKRENILIIREGPGKRTFARVNLLGRDVFNSEYYYLRPNDIVYIESKGSKATSTDLAFQVTPIVLASLTFLLTIAGFFVKVKK